uniref:DUF4238 domain-containing protein n=1 Tax=Shewanella baltica TaxID=62322 RepID=UPI004047504A
MNLAKQNHHYLPRGVLKKFCVGKKKQQIFFINKSENLPAKMTNVKNVACINNFYISEQDSLSLEDDFFRVIDDKAPRVIKKLLVDINKSTLDEDDNYYLMQYVASQIARVPSNYNNIENMASAFEQQVSNEVDWFDEGIKSFFIKNIIQNTKQYQEILSKLSMRVFSTLGIDFEFVIGDNPVIVFEHDGKAVSNDGVSFATEGGVFMMPISPKHLLIYFDPSFRDKLIDYIEAINFWQFVNSSQYVFGMSGKLLEDTLKEHYGYSYDYIKSIKPELLVETGVKRGEPVFIDQMQFSFEGKMLETLKEHANKKINNKAFKSDSQC